MTLAIVLCLLLPLEGYALFRGQRRLFFAAEDALRSRLAALLLAAPGTALHELAHFIACLALGVPAGHDVRGSDGRPAKVEFFHPRRDEDGQGITLGQVPHAATDPLRGALIAVAPVLLVPPLLLGLSYLILGAASPAAIPQALLDSSPWQILLWLYLALSCGQAAFPSPGDHIGVVGGACLALITALIVSLVVRDHGVGRLLEAGADVSLLLTAPAGAAATCLVTFSLLSRWHARRGAR